jgi:hypothetical protein
VSRPRVVARWPADRGFGHSHVLVEAEQPDEPTRIVIESPIFTAIAADEEAKRAERHLDATPLALSPGAG